MIFKREYLVYSIIVFLGLLFYLPFIGAVHLFDWDEVNFAESAREMILSGNYSIVQINFEPFWEKPPLFIWMQVISMKIFGINEFAARFPNVVCGILSLIVLYNIGKRIFDQRFGIIWMIAYFGSILPFLYFKSGIIDPWFNLFIFLGIYYYVRYESLPEYRYKSFLIILSALFIGLGVLTKGPVALLMFGITGLIGLLIAKFKLRISFLHILLWIFVFLVVGGSWFIYLFLIGKSELLKEFIDYQIKLFQTHDAGHSGFPGYHWVIVFLGMFPVSFYALKGLFVHQSLNASQRTYKRWFTILFFAVMIIFSIVKTKIVHYSSLAYFPLSFLGALTVYHAGNNTARVSKWITPIIVLIGLSWVTAAGFVYYALKNIDWLIEFFNIRDIYVLHNLQAEIEWYGFEQFVPFILLLGIMLYLILNRWNYEKSFLVLSFFTALFMFFSTLAFVGKVEKITQNSPVEFYKSVSNDYCYITIDGFKSYAHLYYGDREYDINPLVKSKTWLMRKNVDRPVYLVSKIHKKVSVEKNFPDLIYIGEKNGFIFYKRDLN